MMPSIQVTAADMSSSTRSQISNVLSSFLQECDIVFPHDVQLDKSYRTACYADATRRGIDLKHISKQLDVGIAIGDTAFRHLENYSTRVFIAVWTGLIAHIDDYYEIYEDGLKQFSTRFMHQEVQLYPVLDRLVEMNKELTEHWSAVGADMILTALLDFLTSLRIDISIRGMEIQSATAPAFPRFLRRMSGVSGAYVIKMLPPDLEVKEWIQVCPDMWDFIDHVNDLFSFYKEELVGEDINFISMTAQATGTTKLEVLRQLADGIVKRYHRASELLRPYPEAWNAFRAFCAGYIAFHSLSSRYKLHQLDL